MYKGESTAVYKYFFIGTCTLKMKILLDSGSSPLKIQKIFESLFHEDQLVVVIG